MTDKFKKQLLDYLTGKLTIQTGNNYPQFENMTYFQNDLYTYIADNVTTPLPGSFKLIKGKDSNGAELDEHLLYGIDSDTNTSFIVILDVLFRPIQFIKNYASGTNFGLFETLIIDDDGRFYGVEYIANTNKRRFVMLNNILVKATNQQNYKVVLRQSYNLSDELQTGTLNKLIKKSLGNKYLFCATTASNYPLLVEFTINVGATNDWVQYTYTDNNCSINGVWASWNEDDKLLFKVAATYTSGNTGYLYILNNYGNIVNLLSQFNLPEPTASWIQVIVQNENTIYLSYCYSDNAGIYNQYIYKVGTSLTQIFKSPNTDVAMPSLLMKSELYSDGYNVFISFNVPNADDSIDYYMGIIFNDIVYCANFGALTYTTSQVLYATNTFHQFNLYKYYLQLGDMAYTEIAIFNNFNYNGPEYSDINGLLPNSVILSNNVGYPLFARNLYNRVVNDNVTVSTVEIPNTLMNYNLGSIYEINQQQLLSETNQSLIENIEEIDKNIYETVDINFYNTITMKDSNNLSNEIINNKGAIRLNKSVSSLNDYYDSQATKVKINYNDGTSYSVAIDPSTQITINDNIYTYSFVIYVPTNKNIDNLQIISYDGNTTYATIEGNFEQNKYYRITQNVHIE